MKTPLLDLAARAAKNGVATTRFRISREQADRAKEVERTKGHGDAVALLLKFLPEAATVR